jgi:N-acetylated-alpha-linked acidic dipeptidase
MMEVARLLGNLRLTKDWRPRRTIVFCSWTAQEYGIMGSYEWVDENLKKLSDRAVGYVNTDTCVVGPYVRAAASPTIKNVVVEALKSAWDPTTAEIRYDRRGEKLSTLANTLDILQVILRLLDAVGWSEE